MINILKKRMIFATYIIVIVIMGGLLTTSPASRDRVIDTFDSTVIRSASYIIPMNSDRIDDSWPMFGGGLNHSCAVTTSLTSSTDPVWVHTIGSLEISPMSIAGNRLFVGSNDGRLYCIYATNGSAIWSHATGDSIEYSTPAVVGDRVWVGSNDKSVYCFNVTDGTLLASNTTNGKVFSSPAIYNDSVYIGSNDDKLYRVNATNGSIIWSLTLGGVVSSSPAIDNDSVFVGCGDGSVYCFNASTGSMIWTYSTSSSINIASPSVANGRVYIGSDDGIVHCLYETNGTQAWSQMIGLYIRSCPAIYNGKIYIDCLNGRIYCIDVIDGSISWSFSTNGASIFGSPAIVDGMVYFGASDNYMYCINAITGKFIWSRFTNGHINCSPVISNGNVIFGSSDGKIYAMPMIHESPPYSPVNLAASNGYGFITLTWQPPVSDGGSAITGYNIYRGTSPGSELIVDTIGNTTVYTDTAITSKLNGGQIYYYTVAAINTFGTGNQSNEVGLVLITPLGIYSDADWSRYATSGDGSKANPWIIKNLVVDAHNNDTGMIIMSTNDYATVENCVINRAGANGVGLLLFSANNINLTSDVIDNSSSDGLGLIRCTNIYIDNITVKNSLSIQLFIDNCSDVIVKRSNFLNASNDGVDACNVIQLFTGNSTCYNITLDGCLFTSSAANNTIYLLSVDSTTKLVVNDCTFINSSGMNIHGYSSYWCPNFDITVSNCVFSGFVTAIKAYGQGTGLIIRNCTMHGSKYREVHFVVTLHGINNVVVSDSVIDGYFQTAIEGAICTNVTYIDNIIARAKYEYNGGHGNNNFASGFETGLMDYLTVKGNWFYNCSPAIAIILGINPVVTGNYFNDHLNDLGGKSLYTDSYTYIWDSNFYRDYFVHHPYAVTMNTSTDILQYPYTGYSDAHPRYYAGWYPINTIIHIQIDSTVTGTAISFGSLYVTLDGVIITTSDPVVRSVVFSVIVRLPRGPTYSNKTYNFNATGIYLRIEIDIVQQIYVSYDSTIDGFGLDFYLVKLFINGTRIPVNNPTIISRFSTFVVEDFANVVIYNRTLDLMINGTNIDIGLPIATVQIYNTFNFTVVFYLTHGQKTISYELSPATSVQIRLATGSYSYIVINKTSGREVYDKRISIHASISISLGWADANITIPPIPVPTAFNLSDIVVSVVLAGIIAGVISIVWYDRKRKSPATATTTTTSEQSSKAKKPSKNGPPVRKQPKGLLP